MTKRTRVVIACLAVVLFLAVPPAFAGNITLVPYDQTVHVGEQVSVTLMVDRLSPDLPWPDGVVITEWGFDFLWSDIFLSFDHATFYSFPSDPQADVSEPCHPGWEAVCRSVSAYAPGEPDVAHEYAVLWAYQSALPAAVPLVTLTFNTLAPGETSFVSVQGVLWGLAPVEGIPLPGVVAPPFELAMAPEQFHILPAVADVPEPASLLLLGTGLLGLRAWRKRGTK